MRQFKITHRFDLDRPGRIFLALLQGLPVALFVHVIGLWGSLAALGVLVATGMVSVGLGTSEAAQEAAQEPAERPCDECGAPISDLCPLVEHAPACSLHPSALVA